MSLDSLKQQALDYSLGVLPKEESLLFEALLEQDDDARHWLAEAQEDCAKLSLTAPSRELGEEVRTRVMEHCQKPIDLGPFLACEEIQRLRDNFHAFQNRYSGGGGAVDLSDVRFSKLKDEVEGNYENLLNLFPLVAGDSRAAAGDFSNLQRILRSQGSFTDGIQKALDYDLRGQDPANRSVLRTALATMPSLSFFADRIREKQPSMGDARRLFFLCRDQLKIMRASFRDLDPARLVEEEKLRLHGAGLLQTKWWGAEHAYFSSNGKVRCGHFFDGPVTERCVEFAEYDANMYCLANLLSPRSSDGEFHLELLKDTVPGCTLAVAIAKMDQNQHDSLQMMLKGEHNFVSGFEQDQHLWTLIEDSMMRGHHCNRPEILREQQAFGCKRISGYTYLWFAWPAIPQSHDGADAVTSNPLQ